MHRSAGASRLKPTLRLSRARHYRRPGGPWDLPSLDSVLSGPLSYDGHALSDEWLSLSGTRLEDHIAAVAGGLRGLGVRRGDVVAWQLPNCVAGALLYRACWRLGAVAAPLHHASGETEIVAALDQVQPTLVLAPEGAAVREVRKCVPLDKASDQDPGLPVGPPVRPEQSAAMGSDLAAVLFTSGSTGRPKAVLHTQRGLAWKAVLMRAVHGLNAKDAVLMPAPLAHISGLLNGVLLPAASGMRSLLMGRWEPDRALDIIAGERISFMIGPPTFFIGLISSSRFTPGAVSSLRLVSSGGAAVTPAFVEEAVAALGCRVKRTYGSTEAPTVTTTTQEDSQEMARDTDGRPVGEMELRVSDPETGKALPVGRPGELWVRGPELFVGYANLAETAAAHARGSWFRTGDVATVDEEGWLRIVGRIKDVIIRGGENISATEVEATLEAHPDVRQAVAVPYPDPVMGERVAAFVVAPESFDLEECRRWFDRRGVARFKIPERLVRLEALPTMAAGKPDRGALREAARRA